MDTESHLINELDQYIASGKNRLEAILTALDWTIENTFKERTCTTNKRRSKESIDRNDPFLPDSFGCTNSVVIEKSELQTIVRKQNVSVPDKFSDIQLNFTRDQKLKIYNYVIANTTKTSEPELKVSFPNDDINNAMTFAEIVAKAKKKDKKLQRKYRTSKPTHIEEVRNLVHLQMQALEKYFNPKSESQSRSYRDRDKNSRRSRYERSQSMDEPTRTSSNECRYRTTSGHHQSRRNDRRDRSTRSRSNDRRHRSKDRISPRIVHQRKRSRNRDKVDKSKERHKRSYSPKSEKKHKHYRNH
ncbi:serine/threonine-protein kinase fray2 [Eupeodes corollae]|uniref:serine/threonine-protein kinase fray2 n=1 Tax=Eupeodes corollae TaxID=290404 RepID=UPI00248F545E|nr:serine/threonine-protein kinase fray2 [Eupeodes corollae]